MPDLISSFFYFRSAVEEQLDLIAHGKANFRSVLKHTLDIFKMKFQYFVQNITGMDQLFEVQKIVLWKITSRPWFAIPAFRVEIEKKIWILTNIIS